MSTELFNPLIPGFNPDPSVVRVGDDYYLITSSFEYLPGLPIYHSADFESWEQIGNVATRPEQLDIYNVPTPLGVFAPTIRHHNGLFYVIVTVVGGRGCVIFTATDPAGDWSDGIPVTGLDGIDPDLAWDQNDAAYLTYSGHRMNEDGTRTPSIMQVTVDVATGAILDSPRALWSGTGLKFPEAPHLYQRDDSWYLLIAEGGTERGHAVSVARSPSPVGPFEGAPTNPILSARSTNRPVQNTGHGDIVELPDGGCAMVVLGMRPLGMGQAFSVLGRETFVTRLAWADGWPTAEPVELNPRPRESSYRDSFTSDVLDPGWMAVRRAPHQVAVVGDGALVLVADGDGLGGQHPVFLGRRQGNITAEAAIAIDVARGVGGLAIRYDEHHHYEVEASGTPDGTDVVARINLTGISQEWRARLPVGPVILTLTATPNPSQMRLSDPVERLVFTAAPAADPDARQTIADIDGRYLSAEVVVAFAGRVLGPYCTAGTVTVTDFGYRGADV